MTTEKAQAEFNKLIAENGFAIAGYATDTRNPIYHREWTKNGDKLEVRMILSGTYTLVTVKKNGMIVGAIIRDYSSPKEHLQQCAKSRSRQASNGKGGNHEQRNTD